MLRLVLAEIRQKVCDLPVIQYLIAAILCLTIEVLLQLRIQAILFYVIFKLHFPPQSNFQT